MRGIFDSENENAGVDHLVASFPPCCQNTVDEFVQIICALH